MPNPLPEDLQARFGDAIGIAGDGAWEITPAPEALREALVFLGQERAEPFTYFLDLLGVDTLREADSAGEIEVIYQLSRPGSPDLVRVRTRVSRRGGAVPTVSDLWPGASWPERELMEMFGVTVEGHPDPRHLLLPEGWKGFPLRKDYPYPSDHPYLSRDPLREDPAAVLGATTGPADETSED